MKSGLLTRITPKIAVLSGVVLLLSGCGDVVFESDPCKYTLDGHSVQFHTYQSASWGQADCDEVPTTGLASLSVVFSDKELREMRAGVQVYAMNSWAEAQQTLPTEQSNVVLAIPPQSYPSGVIAVNHEFLQSGYFVNVLTLEDLKQGKTHVVRFPFRVAAATNHSELIVIIALLAIAVGIVGYLRLRANQLLLHSQVSNA
jgi:hypothetical protein